MLTAVGSPLVAGSIASANTMTKKVKVLRSFMRDRKPTKVGDVVELTELGALEVVSSHKAEYVTEPTAPPIDPESNASKGRGSKKDVG